MRSNRDYNYFNVKQHILAPAIAGFVIGICYGIGHLRGYNEGIRDGRQEPRTIIHTTVVERIVEKNKPNDAPIDQTPISGKCPVDVFQKALDVEAQGNNWHVEFSDYEAPFAQRAFR